MHEHVDRVVLERDLELLRPERLPADEVEGLGLVEVPAGGHEGRRERFFGVFRGEGVPDDVGLDLRELGGS